MLRSKDAPTWRRGSWTVTALIFATLLVGKAQAADKNFVNSEHLQRVSAYRNPKTSFKDVIAKRFYNLERPLLDFSFNSPMAIKKTADQIDPSQVTAVDADTLKRTFEFVRDAQVLNDPQNPFTPTTQPTTQPTVQNLRRLTWLFPDDGCYARAQLSSRIALKEMPVRPSKLFVFGDLSIKTPNHPTGMVTWWYHVASVLRVNNDLYILDPAIEPKQALPLANWLALMHSPNAEVSVCSAFAYSPDTPCNAPENPDVDTLGINDETNFLSSEWSRLIELGRDPSKELGDAPPWRTQP